jgi:4-amino-4-deoxy-L-arabinose transferase-like glycosyltransferase
MRPQPLWHPRLRYATFGTLIALGFVLLYLILIAGHFANLADPSAMDYAQVARRLVQGKGLTTQLLRPLSLVSFPSISEHPELVHPPLQSCLIAAVMRVAGTEAKAAALASGIAFLLTLPLVYLLGHRLLGMRAGLLAMLLVGTNLGYLQMAVSGTEICLGAFLTTALWLTLISVSREERVRAPMCALAGALAGLLYLTNYLWIALLAGATAYLIAMLPRGKRLRLVALTVGCFVVICLPWWYRNWVITRDPFFTYTASRAVMDTRSHRGNTLYRSCSDEALSFPAYAVSRPHEVWEKTVSVARNLYATLPDLVGLWVMPFLIAAILVYFGHREFEVFRLVLYGTTVLLGLGLTVIATGPRALMVFAPAMTVIAAGYFLRLMAQRTEAFSDRAKQGWHIGAVLTLLCLQALPLFFALAPGAGAFPEEVAPDRAALELASVIDGPVITDIPWTIAWVTDRPAIWLPALDTDLAKLQTVIGSVKWLLLTPQVMRNVEEERMQDWAQAWQRGRLADTRYGDFVVYKRFSGSNWVLFRRTAVPQATETR